mgnify:CR=1 FL=1
MTPADRDLLTGLFEAAVEAESADRASWSEVFARPESSSPVDVDQDLYGSFLSDADRSRLTRLRGCDPLDPAWREAGFDDPRLPELVFRYRARNFPATLTPEEVQRWQAHCQARLLHGEGVAAGMAGA